MICIPITASTTEKATKDIEKASTLADVIELRLDFIKNFDLKKLLAKKVKPVIVTNRKKEEGGKFQGSEEERVKSLLEAINLGVDYVDIEATTPKEFLNKLRASKGETKIIISHHDFKKTENLIGIYNKIKNLGDIVKIVTYANDASDNIKVFELINKAKSEDKEIIAFCMGEKGIASRLLCERLGSYLTFASLEKGKESAEGQITVEQLVALLKKDKNSI